ncbi:MAG TPA: DinB family protein [Prosthecobacter sp.]
MDTSSSPKLAPPGAGLPWLELFILRGLFKTRLALGSPASFNRQFAVERERIRILISGLSESEGARQVLIRRPVGLEDSSRHWSVWMTLEHLRIMHKAIAGLVRSLTAGVVPPGEASTAAMKPQEGITSAIVLKYEASCDTVLKTLNASGAETAPFPFAHPWFGPLTIRGWHAMAALHLGIHRRQIERVLSTR